MGWPYGTPKWVIDVLLRGDPDEISWQGIGGVDADAAMSVSQILAAEEAGLKEPGRPMTVTQLAKALLSGLLDPRTKIANFPTQQLHKPGSKPRTIIGDCDGPGGCYMSE